MVSPLSASQSVDADLPALPSPADRASTDSGKSRLLGAGRTNSSIQPAPPDPADADSGAESAGLLEKPSRNCELQAGGGQQVQAKQAEEEEDEGDTELGAGAMAASASAAGEPAAFELQLVGPPAEPSLLAQKPALEEEKAGESDEFEPAPEAGVPVAALASVATPRRRGLLQRLRQVRRANRPGPDVGGGGGGGHNQTPGVRSVAVAGAGVSGADDEPSHLEFFELCGKMLAKAIIDDMRISTQFTSGFYKHMLGLPVAVEDLAAVDPQLYDSLAWILHNPIDQLGLELYFDATVDRFGQETVVELVPGGHGLAVTDGNKEEFVAARSRWALVGMVEGQLDAVRAGFVWALPGFHALGFDALEMELLLNGVPTISTADWQAHCDYRGAYDRNHPTVLMFWRAVEEFDPAQRCGPPCNPPPRAKQQNKQPPLPKSNGTGLG